MLTSRERAGLQPTPLAELASSDSALDGERLREAFGDAFLLLDSDVVRPVSEAALQRTAVMNIHSTQQGTRLEDLLVFAVRKSVRNFEPVITLGRSASCDLVIAHPSVSARHALFIVTGHCVALYDAGSTNGTTINGDPVPLRSDAKPLPLTPLSRLRFGSVETTYLDADRLCALIGFARQR